MTPIFIALGLLAGNLFYAARENDYRTTKVFVAIVILMIAIETL